MTIRGYLTRLIWLCVLPLLLLAAAIAVVQVRSIHSHAERDAATLAAYVSAGLEAEMEGYARGLAVLAASPIALDEAHRAEWMAAATAFSRAFGAEVVIAHGERRMFLNTAAASAGPSTVLPRPAGRSAFAIASTTGRPAVSDAFDGPILKQRLVALAVASAPDVRPPRVAIALLPADALQRHLAKGTLPAGWGLALRDGKGQQLAAVGERSAGLSVFHERRVADAMAEGWSLAVEAPAGAGEAATVRAGVLLALGVVGLGAAALVGGTLGSQALARAVRSLAEQRVPSGTVPDLSEIAAARTMLDDAAAQRDMAEAQRRETEQAFRARLESVSHALAASEARLRAVFECASEAILTVSSAQRITLANAAAGKMFGYPVESLVGMPLEQLVPERFRDAHRGWVDAFFGEGDLARRFVGQPDFTVVRPDGTECFVAATISRGAVEGEPFSMAVMRDVTEQKRREEALAQANALLALAQRAAGAGLWSREIATGALTWSAELFGLFGLDPATAEASEATWRRVVHPEDAGLVERTIRAALVARVPIHVRHRIVVPSGAVRWIDAYGDTTYGPDGRAVRSSGICIDSTALVQAEQDRRRLVGELEAAEDRERRQIARDLHDDLAQTLAAARIRLSPLREAAAPEVREPARRVDALLEAAEAGARSLAAQLAPAALYELGLVAALEVLGEEIERTYGIAVTIVDDGAPKPLAPEVGSILYRATRELLINVAKHAKTDAAAVEVERTDGQIVVRVADGGIGFEPPGPSSTHRGLGLASVRERLRFIGGRMEIRSIPGDGTVAELTAPLALDSSQEEAA